MNKNISQANLPNIKLTVDSFSLGRGNMDITGGFNNCVSNDVPLLKNYLAGAFTDGGNIWAGRGKETPQHDANKINFVASRSWTGTTNSASPQTSSLGSGQALDITPSYYTTHMWLRTN